MSTNFYLHAPACSHCGQEPHKPLHLGKSSAGWCFGLHVYPEKDLNDWHDIWSHISFLTEEKDYEIRNEYGERIESGLFFTIVWDRSGKPEKLIDRQWLEENHAVPGPFGLARHKIDGRCIGHDGGPFDYIIGEFS